MFEWKLEDMALLNEESKFYIGKTRFYDCESKVTREEKIAFVDSMNDGKLTYILDLWEKYKQDEINLVKDRYGYVKTVSLKAWIKRNDPKKILDDSYHYGGIRFIVRRNIQFLDKKGGYDIYSDYVDEVFHEQLKKCEKMEKQYFLEHDEYSILKEKYRNRCHNTNFGVKIAICSDGEIYVYDDDEFDNNKRRPITIDELKILLSKYDKLDSFIEELSKEVNIVY